MRLKNYQDDLPNLKFYNIMLKQTSVLPELFISIIFNERVHFFLYILLIQVNIQQYRGETVVCSIVLSTKCVFHFGKRLVSHF